MIIIPSNVMAAPSDPFFSNTVLLLKTVGVGGASNSAFRDDSANNFVPVRNGDVTQGGLSPYVPTGYWSNYFDGSGDYLAFPASSAFAFGTGDFTVECWVYIAATTPTASGIFQQGTSLFPGTTANSVALGTVTSGNFWQIYVKNTNYNSTATWTTNTWYHCALVRSSGTSTLYVNGTAVITQTGDTTDYTGTFFGIGHIYGGFPLNGHVSNLRVVKGTAVYTANFTPPTAPLTAIAGTSLLTCQDNRFIDRSTNNFVLTRNGDVSVQRFAPFGIANTVTTHLASTGSVTFDGNGDYLTAPSNAAIQFGAGDFCVEFWWVGQPTGSYTQNIGTTVSGTEEGTWRIGTRFNNSNIIYFSRGNGSGFDEPQYSKNVNDGAWHHIACVRSSGIISMYVDGQKLTPSTGSENIAGTCSSSNQLFICYNGRDNAYSAGNMSNVRVVKGSPVYTSSFTPPTAPLTAVTGTSLLTCQDAVTVTDASTNNFTVTRVGDARASEVSPFKRSSSAFGGSGYFDGAGDWLTVGPNAALAPGSGNFTYECWINIAAPSNSPIMESRGTDGSQGGFTLTALSSTQIRVFTNTAVATATVANYAGAWTHVAVVKSGSTTTLYVNGVAGATTTAVGNLTDTDLIIGGGRYSGGGSVTFSFGGFISNFRYAKTAVYTANFTPPTEPLTAITGTSLLLNFDNAGVYDATGQQNLRTVGSASSSTLIRKHEISSLTLDGTGAYVVPTGSLSQFTFGGDFTIEFWAYFNNLTGTRGIFDWRPNASQAYTLPVLYTSDSTMFYNVGGVNRISTTVATSTWYHVAVSRAASQTRLFINGVAAGTYADASTYTPTTMPNFGRFVDPTYMNGYIEGLRVSRVGRYVANFTPPTTELPTR